MTHPPNSPCNSKLVLIVGDLSASAAQPILIAIDLLNLTPSWLVTRLSLLLGAVDHQAAAAAGSFNTACLLDTYCIHVVLLINYYQFVAYLLVFGTFKLQPLLISFLSCSIPFTFSQKTQDFIKV